MRLLITCWFLLLASSAAAGEPLTLDRLQAVGQTIRTLRLEFVQEKDLAIFDEPVLTPGVVELDRTRGALRWEFTNRSVLILSDGRLRKWDASGREDVGMDRDPNLIALRGQMQALLTGDWRSAQDLFTVTTGNNGVPTVELRPRDPALGKYLDRIVLRFRADLSAPEQLILEAPGGDVTTYRFAEPVIDADIADARFNGP